ncbi:hypothetical protein QP932_06085 [Corynebacterium freneyi]|uniref:hypothetical protein n=1 Tax=Corynebacterium freneyi TaxID=134034 RepID=UPI00254CD869|nr:hypothetical protein [Corynebacterium freneyi]MDK8768070.1 hypothetical protein [Corynebacterium freneyi]
MSDEKLTVAELLARRDKERGGSAEAAERPRRRRRSLEEGGISVAELTGSIPRVKADGPRRGAHAAVEDAEQIEDRAEDQVTEAAETADSAEAAEAGESTESGDSTEAAEVDESADVAEVPDEADSAEVESVEAESVEEAVEEPAAEDTAEEPVAEEAVEESAAEEPVEEPAAVEEPADEPVAEEAVEEAAAEESVTEPVAEQPAAVEEPREPREPFSIPSAVPVDPRPVMANDETGEITFTFTKFHDARTGTEPVAEAGPMAREVLEGSMAYDDRPTNVIPVVEDDEDEAEVAVDDAASAREWDEADDRAFDGSAIADGTFTGGSAALADHVDDVPAAYREHDAEYGAEYEDDYDSDHDSGYEADYEDDYDSGYDPDYESDYDADHVAEYGEEYDAEPASEDQRRRGFVDFSDPSDEPESVDPHASAASATAAAPAVKESGAPKSTKDREDYVEDNSLSIGLLIAQTIVGLLFGGLIFALFLMLWMALPKAVVVVIAVAFSFGLVIGVNLIRRERDRLTPVLAGIVGLVVSFAPYVLTMV